MAYGEIRHSDSGEGSSSRPGPPKKSWDWRRSIICCGGINEDKDTARVKASSESGQASKKSKENAVDIKDELGASHRLEHSLVKDDIASTGTDSFHSFSDSSEFYSVRSDFNIKEEKDDIYVNHSIDNMDDIEIEHKETLQFNEEVSSKNEIGESSNDKHDNLEKNIIEDLKCLAKDQLLNKDLLAQWKEKGYDERKLTKAIGNILQEVLETYETKKDERKRKWPGLVAEGVEKLKQKSKLYQEYDEFRNRILKGVEKIQAGKRELSASIDFAKGLIKVQSMMEQLDEELEKKNAWDKMMFIKRDGPEKLEEFKKVMGPAMQASVDSVIGEGNAKEG